jgi:hypothetical protein
VAAVVRMADEQTGTHTGVVAMDSRQAREVVNDTHRRMLMAERGSAEYDQAHAEYRDAKKEYHDILFAEFLRD